MCGISGFYSPNKKFSEYELHLMTNSIAHRGPDAYGYFTDEIAGLGHRRLSILDLSDSANQPMHSRDEKYVIIYNGEVYNFEEIAEELKQKYKTEFRTTSDTEVLLEAFARYGSEFVHKLNGMFALAIYDKQEKQLFIFRDRIGIKPLYYFWDGESFAFASELKALIKTNFIPLEIDENAIYHFLHLGFIPSPLSIYKSIKKLPSGTWLKISKNNLEAQKYWSVNEKITEEIISDKKQAHAILDDLLKSSVRYQIKSDVPFGVFLSGGIDSSLITANAVNVSKSKVNTFSIGFEENQFNESHYSKEIARHLGTNHHELIVSQKDSIDLIDIIFDSYDEPFADSSCIPTMLVSKLAKKHVTVALSGEGADELFYGYGAYQWAARLNNPIIKYFRKPIANILSGSPKFNRHSEYFKYPDANLQYSHILSQEQYFFSQSELGKVLSLEFKTNANSTNTKLLKNFALQIDQVKRTLKPIEKQALFDLNFYLQDDLLTKVDRASMHFSLETRVPFLDHRIIEFALNLSPELKFKNGTSKYLLKEVLYQYIPKTLMDRPKKGFAIPLAKWLKSDLSFLLEDYLSEKIITQFNYVNYEYVKKLKNDFLNNEKDHLYNRLWNLIVLHKWLSRNTG